jgi:hypothetical protein
MVAMEDHSGMVVMGALVAGMVATRALSGLLRVCFSDRAFMWDVSISFVVMVEAKPLPA